MSAAGTGVQKLRRLGTRWLRQVSLSTVGVPHAGDGLTSTSMPGLLVVVLLREEKPSRTRPTNGSHSCPVLTGIDPRVQLYSPQLCADYVQLL